MLAGSASIFGRPLIFYIQRSRQMALSQQEYLSRLISQQPKLIARNTVRTQGEQVLIVQARASKYASPSVVGGYANQNGTCKVVFNAPRGNGVEGTYLGILQKAQGCAICADPDPVVNAFQELIPQSCIQPVVNTPTLPPLVGTIVTADFTGLVFASGGGGDTYLHTFTFPSTNIVNIILTNVGPSISLASHIDLRNQDDPVLLNPADTFVLVNPAYTPNLAYVTYGPGGIYSQLYTNDSNYIHTTSIITATFVEARTSITISIN